MVYSYTPTYYSTLHESISSLCKSILPFSFKKRCLPAADHKLAKLQSDNLKWQQDSFHQMLKLIGLHKEGILPQNGVSEFRTHLLDSLIASPPEHEQPPILRDKILFLQELLYAKCITEDEYHSSKRPLLQRLAVQGAEIESRDVIVADPKDRIKENPEEEWSVIDLRDEKSLLSKEKSNSNSKNRLKHVLSIKQIRGAASVFSFGSSQKSEKNRSQKSIFDSENQLTHSILMPESSVERMSEEKVKRRPFRTLFQKEQGHDSNNYGPDYEEERMSKSGKKQWSFNGLKKWRRDESEDETAPLPLHERSDSEAHQGSNSTQLETSSIKRKMNPPSDFSIQKNVLGEKIKKELSRIQTELGTTNPHLNFSEDQIEAISTRLPVDKADLKNFFPKSWCDRYGDVVVDVVKKEFKEHVGEMENKRCVTSEKLCNSSNSKQWTTFEDDENLQPNLFQNNPFVNAPSKNTAQQMSFDPVYENPFWSSSS